MYTNWIQRGILFINDILDEKGNISSDKILSKLSNKTNQISEFCKLKKAIQTQWIQKVKLPDSLKTNVKTNTNLYLNENNKTKTDIKNMVTKEFYNYINAIMKENSM